MAKIIFNGFNSNENPFVLNSTATRLVNSQNIKCVVDNEQGTIEFTVSPSLFVSADCQAKSIKTIMDDFVVYNCHDEHLKSYNKQIANLVDDVVSTCETDDATVTYQAD